MRKFGIFLLAAAATGLHTPAATAANVQINADDPVVEIQVSEQINSAPDTATFSTGVSTMAVSASEALRQNSQKVRQVITRIKSLGIADKDIQTTGINLNAEYEYIRATQSQRFKGYRVNNNVQVKVREIDRLGNILDAVVAAGATNLNGPHFTLDDDDAVKKAARASGLKRGREQALSYAQAAGYSNVRLLLVSENIRGQSRLPRPVNASADIMLESSAAPVQPGEVGTVVNLALTFEMSR